MTETVRCQDLKIAECDFVAQAPTPLEVIQEVVEHLETEHGLEMPAPQVILEGEPLENVEEEVALIVGRLRETLDIQTEGPEEVEADVSPPPPSADKSVREASAVAVDKDIA